MVGVFAIFATLNVLEMKQMGVGLAAAILIDATLIRAVLLPASMKLLGDWNWYLPSWLEWLPHLHLLDRELPPPRGPDAPPALVAHLTTVAHAVGVAISAVWAPPRLGMMVAGFEVPHLHLHVFGASSMAEFDFANAARTVEPAEQDKHAAALRAALRAGGHRAFVPS